MRSALFAVLVGLVGAALLHIVIILALPQFTGRDAYTRVLGLFEMDRFFPLTDEAGTTGLSNDDPFLKVAVCGFSVSAGPARFEARGSVPFWSLAVYDDASNEVFSMNDRTSVNGSLDLVMATPIQLTAIRKALPEALSRSILVEMPVEEGYAVLRVLSPTGSYEPAARNFLSEATCGEFSAQ